VATVLGCRASNQPQQQEAQADAAQPEKADLPITKLQDLRKQVAPTLRRDEGVQTLEHQHQSQRGPQEIAVQVYFLAAGAVCPRKVLKKSEPEGSTTITSLFLAKLAL
jgi:hypothetical protein